MTDPAAREPPVRVYDPDEAAVILRCKASWLKEKARRREIPFTMLGGAYRWTGAHLAEIIKLSEQAPAAPLAQVPRRRTSPASDSAPVLRARPPRKPRNPGPNGAGHAAPGAADAA